MPGPMFLVGVAMSREGGKYNRGGYARGWVLHGGGGQVYQGAGMLEGGQVYQGGGYTGGRTGYTRGSWVYQSGDRYTRGQACIPGRVVRNPTGMLSCQIIIKYMLWI